jgi:hypothetical protein
METGTLDDSLAAPVKRKEDTGDATLLGVW